MFSSLKLNSLKCQSKNASEKKKDKCDDNDEDDDDVSEQIYEKLPNYDGKTCRCHSNYNNRSPKNLKTSLTKRICKWRMECPGIPNLRISRTEDLNSKYGPGERKDMYSPTSFNIVRAKVTTVNIAREDGNLGITLRGGFQRNADSAKPITITYVRPDGPAAREGTINCGDRLLAVDGIPLQGKSLSEAQTLLRQPTPSALLTIEYDVTILENVEQANGPLLIEMELNSSQELGLKLGQYETGVIIESVKPGSLSDRCGAFHIGDEILAVNCSRFDHASVTPEEVEKCIDCNCPTVRLEILPYYANFTHSAFGTWRHREHFKSYDSNVSAANTLRSNTSRKNQDGKNTNIHDIENVFNIKAPTIDTSCFQYSNVALTHSETVQTTIYKEKGVFGLECVDTSVGTVIISRVTNGSPAERSQCLYPGDRILSINNRNVATEKLTAKDMNDLFLGKSDKSCSKLILLTEFDVLDSVIPTSGDFTVKLVKRGSSGLGITITASKSSGFMVCEMKKGSIAYRAGSLIPGDKILAINNIPLNQCSVEYAAHILHQSSKIVILRVQRKDYIADSTNIRKVNYTVELQRYGGPLGITIAGSEEPFHPVTISGLTSGGLAEQTGVLHIGDEILAINDHSLYGEPLSKALSLLQNSPDFVTLKISRSIAPYFRLSRNLSGSLPPPPESTTSSWNTSRMDGTKITNYSQQNLRNSRDFLQENNVQEIWPTQDESCSVKLTNGLTRNSIEEIPHLSLLDEITSENLKIKKELDLLSCKLDAQCTVNNGNVGDNPRSTEKFNQKLFLNLGDSGIQNSEDGNSKNINSENLITHLQPDINMDLDIKESAESLNVQKCGFSSDIEQVRESLSTQDFDNLEVSYLSDSKNWLKSNYIGNESNSESMRNEFHSSQLHKILLYKDPIYEDFGFSVSDGLYERGVFINRIRKGGPADINNALKPYDRILQVNDTFTQDFDCCLTVPLIASAGDSITLLVARSSGTYSPDNVSFSTMEQERAQVLEDENVNRKSFDSSQNNITLDTDLEGSRRILV